VGIDIAMHAENRFNSLLAIGVTTWITLQAFLNIGANLAVFPFGGMPLPFLSYGGSNTIVVLIGVGLLLNISRTCKEKR
jgi:cell division protein FtsW